MNHYTQTYKRNGYDDDLPDDRLFLTILFSHYTTVKGKPKFTQMNCFGATRKEAIDKAQSIIDGRAEAEIRRLKRIEKAKAAKQRKAQS